MRRELSVAIACLSGFTIVIAHFLDITPVQIFSRHLQDWAIVVAACAIAVSAISLVLVNVNRILRAKDNAWRAANSVLILSLFLVTAVMGLQSQDNEVFIWLYDYMMKPLGVTFVSMSMFYIATAAYRAFRAESIEAALLLGAGIIVLLGNAPIVAAKLGWVSEASGWVMKIPNMAGRRGLLIGASIGAVQTGLRVICGIDRSYSARGT